MWILFEGLTCYLLNLVFAYFLLRVSFWLQWLNDSASLMFCIFCCVWKKKTWNEIHLEILVYILKVWFLLKRYCKQIIKTCISVHVYYLSYEKNQCFSHSQSKKLQLGESLLDELVLGTPLHSSWRQRHTVIFIIASLHNKLNVKRLTQKLLEERESRRVKSSHKQTKRQVFCKGFCFCGCSCTINNKTDSQWDNESV